MHPMAQDLSISLQGLRAPRAPLAPCGQNPPRRAAGGRRGARWCSSALCCSPLAPGSPPLRCSPARYRHRALVFAWGRNATRGRGEGDKGRYQNKNPKPASLRDDSFLTHLRFFWSQQVPGAPAASRCSWSPCTCLRLPGSRHGSERRCLPWEQRGCTEHSETRQKN